MASKGTAAIALLVSLNLLFFSLANAALPPLPSIKPDPIATLKNCNGYDLRACLGVLSGIRDGILPSTSPCCAVLKGLVDANAQVCLCSIVKLKLLRIVKLALTANLELRLRECGIPHPTYNCPDTPSIGN